jgi:hypothetical protein
MPAQEDAAVAGHFLLFLVRVEHKEIAAVMVEVPPMEEEEEGWAVWETLEAVLILEKEVVHILIME